MKKALKVLCLLAIVSVSYLAGSSQILETTVLNAQEKPEKLTKEEQERIDALMIALSTAMENMKESQKYRPAIEGVNSFAISVGGLDAIADLESGDGVDPETFAGLYAGYAVPEITENLGRDDKGRVTYKNKVVQLYSISRLKAMFTERAEFFSNAVQ